MVWYIPIIPLSPYILNQRHHPPTQPSRVFTTVFNSIDTTLPVVPPSFPRGPLISRQYHHVTLVNSFRLGLAAGINLGIHVNFG